MTSTLPDPAVPASAAESQNGRARGKVLEPTAVLSPGNTAAASPAPAPLVASVGDIAGLRLRRAGQEAAAAQGDRGGPGVAGVEAGWPVTHAPRVRVWACRG
ncbi:hypothetical protein GCM10010412_097910 [Nonomuraea recticatena]|uniref:Uncharacterized protein n=1 Tax=Nonomuraea recticatena TaxID=46178 RepID=A0ABP6FU30_9ACTN